MFMRWAIPFAGFLAEHTLLRLEFAIGNTKKTEKAKCQYQHDPPRALISLFMERELRFR
jgi:hypothetical protein